ncbi:MAG TPA: transporter suffix domain-containing protein, partial [Pseudonocardia sp.]|nr:transporter suffix domain-containing protein [Pseudonocardia sp.]
MLFRVGLIAIVLSVVPWLAIGVAPLLGLSLGASAGLIGVSLVVAEVLFWTGLALAGKDTWQTIKARG